MPSSRRQLDQKHPVLTVFLTGHQQLTFRTDGFAQTSGLWIIISVPVDLLPSGASVVLPHQNKQAVNLGPRQLSAASSSKLKRGNHDVQRADTPGPGCGFQMAPPPTSLLLLLLTVKANQACLLYDSGFLAVADSSSSKQPLIRAWKNLEQVH